MFKTRLMSGIVLLAIAVTVFILGGLPLGIVLGIISVIGYLEMTKALAGINEKHTPNTLEILGSICIAVLYLVVLFTTDAMYLMMAVGIAVMVQLFAYVFAFPKFEANQVVDSVFAFLYIPFMLTFVYLTRQMPEYGKYLVWLIIISSWGCDTCAYCVGKLIGKKKIFPVLSPHKSLEGCFGGVIGAALIGFLYGYFYVEKMTGTQYISIVLAVICAVGGLMSMVGDLAASAIKRNKGIKDYGKLIPGHGGIMDRFDSMIVTAPATFFAAYLLLQLL